MAGEITVLEGNGNRDYTLLFIFPIASPKQVGGINVVPTPATGLSTTALAILTAQQETALNDGTSGWRIKVINADPALTGPQLTARVKEIYAAELADFTAWYTLVYKYVGTVINYP